MKIDKNVIIDNICYTELVYARINKKLSTDFSNNEIEDYLKNILIETDDKFYSKTGKNYYVTNLKTKIRITINSNTFRIITVDRLKEYKAVKEYTDVPANPVIIEKDEVLAYIKESDPQGDWPNWVYCRGENKEGWIPRQILDIRPEMVVVLDDYSAREHVLTSGDIFIAEKNLNGWIWGYKKTDPGLPGWAPLNCLELIQSGSASSV